ncbi:MAG: amidohydrolase, partial [Oscillospiraceae bacterium]|nr:amidohydrolase [Oscillospiraceae bacterium]
MKTRIENVTILTMDKDFNEYANSSITIEDDRIIAINDDTIPVDKVIDGRNGILMPGMVNTHAHLAMIPFRGLGDDCPDRLRRFLFPLESKTMTEKLVSLSSEYAAAEMMLGGVTQVYDMYFFEDAVAQAMVKMNMRATLAETILDFAHCNSDKPYGGLDYSEWFIKKWKNAHPLITPSIAPHATNTNSADALQRANKIAQENDVLISMHVSEMDYEMDYFRKEYDMTPVEFLDSIGLLTDRLLAVHCIHATENDVKLFREKGVRVSHCVGSNTKAGKGIMPLKAMMAEGVTVGLGTDGASSGNTIDIITQLGMVTRAHKTANHDRGAFTAKEILALATIGGAKALGTDNITGSLEVGKKADIVLIETESVNMFPVHDPYSAIVYSANPSNVDSVWIDGM